MRRLSLLISLLTLRASVLSYLLVPSLVTFTPLWAAVTSTANLALLRQCRSHSALLARRTKVCSHQYSLTSSSFIEQTKAPIGLPTCSSLIRTALSCTSKDRACISCRHRLIKANTLYSLAYYLFRGDEKVNAFPSNFAMSQPAASSGVT